MEWNVSMKKMNGCMNKSVNDINEWNDWMTWMNDLMNEMKWN